MTPKKNTRRAVVLVGTGPLARATLADLRDRRDVEVLGAFTLQSDVPQPSLQTPVLGTASSLDAYLLTTSVDEVYLAGDVVRDHAELQAAGQDRCSLVCDRSLDVRTVTAEVDLADVRSRKGAR